MATKLTPRQLQLLEIIVLGGDDGAHLNLDQLRERLPGDITKNGVHYLLKSIIEEQLVKKEIGLLNSRVHVFVKPTEAGLTYLREYK